MLVVPKVIPVATPMQVTATPQPTKAGEKINFAEQLHNALNNVNEMQLKAEDYTTKLALGEIEDLHQVTIAMEEAKLSLQLAVQVRNKMIEAYQEIARMQV